MYRLPCCIRQTATWHEGLLACLDWIAACPVKEILMQALSVDGRCKTFDASADGYGRGEGFAVAYLSPSASSSHPLAILQVLLHYLPSHSCTRMRRWVDQQVL